ncbi:NUDIX hydrolase [Nocardiopsis sp. NRRL B-16309]|uniref:NUDIX hydrolase n=1 Tax=Nocardiopsis sp. NRRL B-16309 TaxID=1519494 RepID=UPI0006AF5CB8|nr:NUDIX domain-containing protein [Nocardiopsis sp. NRRL B-16309]KOX16690.1 DNA mismatch repair protein MutT [Nocardiopsis sp. NRRL B-16309]
MARTEYYDDPAAPAPNSLVPAATAAVFDEGGQLLLRRRADHGLWVMPGGAVAMTESLAQAAVREVWEETGYEVRITGLVGTYTDARHVVVHNDGEVRRQFTVCFRAQPVRGELRAGDTSLEAAWFAQEELGVLPMHRTQRLRVDHALRGGKPHLG